MQYESVIFIGGPLDGQYLNLATNQQHYEYHHLEPELDIDDMVDYSRVSYQWKDGNLAQAMLKNDLSPEYREFIEKSIEKGKGDDVPLAVVFLCLPTIEQFEELYLEKAEPKSDDS